MSEPEPWLDEKLQWAKLGGCRAAALLLLSPLLWSRSWAGKWSPPCCGCMQRGGVSVERWAGGKSHTSCPGTLLFLFPLQGVRSPPAPPPATATSHKGCLCPLPSEGLGETIPRERSRSFSGKNDQGRKG